MVSHIFLIPRHPWKHRNRGSVWLDPIKSYKKHRSQMVSHIFGIFHPENWGNDPIWRAYFSNGLVQPATSDYSPLVNGVLNELTHIPLNTQPFAIPIASMYGISTYIYHILPLKTTMNVGKYASPMDAMGYEMISKICSKIQLVGVMMVLNPTWGPGRQTHPPVHPWARTPPWTKTNGWNKKTNQMSHIDNFFYHLFDIFWASILVFKGV